MTGESPAYGAVILDKHPLWLDAVEAVITKLGIRVIGKATTKANALELLSANGGDILIADLGDGAEGIEFLADVCERFKGLRTIVLSDDDHKQIAATLNAGADAYVVKTAHPDDLATAIRQLFVHSIYIKGARIEVSPIDATRELQVELTRREVEVLRLVAEGHSNTEAAKLLWVTEQTVKFHLANIYRKLGVSNRTEASRWAHVHHLLAESPSAVESRGGAFRVGQDAPVSL